MSADRIVLYDRRRFQIRASRLTRQKDDGTEEAHWIIWMSHYHGDHHGITDPDRVEELGRGLLEAAEKMRAAQGELQL